MSNRLSNNSLDGVKFTIGQVHSTLHTCPECREQFYGQPAQTYCSNECKVKAQRLGHGKFKRKEMVTNGS